MRTLSILLFILGLLFQTGCTSQARKTHLVFEKESATHSELHEALEALKPVGHDGATHHQYKAVKALRHIAKHMEDPAKREMGTRALVFLAFFNDDRNVKISSLSRIEAILESNNQDLSMKAAVIDELEKIVTAKTGYTVTDTSIFNDRVTRNYIYPEIDAREEALEFLADRFEDFPESLQYLSLRSFERILQNPVTCYELDDGKCDEDDAEDQQDWKQELMEKIGDWLEEDSVSAMIKTALVRLVEEAATADKGSNSPRSLLENWVQESDIPQHTRDTVQSALNKLESSFPEMLPQDSKTALVPYASSEDFRYLDNYEETIFWFANSKLMLEGQLFRQESPGSGNTAQETDPFMQVPAEWIIYDGYSSDPASIELKEIIFDNATQAFKRGYILSPTEDLLYSLDHLVSTSSDQSGWALDRTLAVITGLYPSLKQGQENIDSLVDLLTGRIPTEASIYRKRQIIFTLVEGLPYFRDTIEYTLCPVLKETDLLTRHLAKVRAASLAGPIKPLTISQYRRQIISGAGKPLSVDPAGAEAGQYLQTFCGEDITGLKPKPPQLEFVTTPAAKRDQAPAADEPSQ